MVWHLLRLTAPRRRVIHAISVRSAIQLAARGLATHTFACLADSGPRAASVAVSSQTGASLTVACERVVRIPWAFGGRIALGTAGAVFTAELDGLSAWSAAAHSAPVERSI